MNISQWGIKNPLFVCMLFVILTFVGLIAFQRLQIQNFPDMDSPSATITISLSGATPTQLETQVTRKVENSLSNITQIKHITSTISSGSSVTTVEFELSKDMQDGINEIKESVDKIKEQFPSGASEPTVTKVNVGSQSILTYQISAKHMDAVDLSWFVDNDINKLLTQITGVGKIVRQGGVDREVHVTLDPLKLMAVNAAIDDISSELYSVQQDFSGGRTRFGHQEQTMQSGSTIHQAQDLNKLIIPLSTGSYIKLGDVANISDTTAETRQMAFLNEKSITSFQVFAAKGSSELSVANLVRKTVHQFNDTHKNIVIHEISNSVAPIQSSYNGSMQALYEGAILAIIVVWLFLRDFRATFISSIALPLSILPTFLCMYWFGFTLNTITLLALTLVIGILVDDAIVEVENIERHLHNKKTVLQAVIDATQEIGIAVIATSLTLLAVFLPTAFMGGIPGRIFKQFGWTAAIAVLSSLLVARLLTPMMAAFMMKEKKSPQIQKQSKSLQLYLKGVNWCLMHRAKTMIFTLGFFLVSISLTFFIPTTFFPSQDNGQIVLNVTLQPGSTIKQTMGVLNQSYKILKQVSDIKSMYATIGNGAESGQSASSDSDVTSATLTLNLKDSHHRKLSQSAIENTIQTQLQRIPGGKFSLGGQSMGQTYALVLAGDDAALLDRVITHLSETIRQTPGLESVTSTSNRVRPQIIITPDLNNAAKLGVTATNIGQVIRIATSGDYDNNLPKMNAPERQIPIRVQLAQHASQSMDAFSNIRVSGSNGAVPLSSVASVKIGSGPVQVSRYDRHRSATLNIDLHGMTLGEANQKIQHILSAQSMPQGIQQIASGELEHMNEMFGNFSMAMITGILCVYCILGLLFKDLKQPITILAALPLAIGGALGSLAFFGYSLSMPSLIGILMLMGIVTKNSILLVDYAKMAISEKRYPSRKAAILSACAKRSRPIIMTTIAMIVGMLPIALGAEGDASFRSPMAITVIGGLITSTVLSLFVIPVIFELVDDLKR